MLVASLARFLKTRTFLYVVAVAGILALVQMCSSSSPATPRLNRAARTSLQIGLQEQLSTGTLLRPRQRDQLLQQRDAEKPARDVARVIFGGASRQKAVQIAASMVAADATEFVPVTEAGLCSTASRLLPGSAASLGC